MEYNDFNNAELPNQYKKSTYGDIHDEIFINEKKYTFHRNKLFGDMVSIMLPDSFQDMPETLKKIKYPAEQRPSIIKSNESGDINFTFNLLEVPLEEETIMEMTGNLKNVIVNMNTAVVMQDEGVEDVCGTKAGWFSFISYVFDGQLFNIMYCMPVNGKMLHGIFNCMVQDREAWEPVAKQVIQSLIIK